MDEKTITKIRALLPAVKALHDSVRRASNTGAAGGVAKMGVRSYEKLHNKIAALLPDDDYITEALVLDIDEGDSDETIAAQLELALNQMNTYLNSLLSNAGEPRFSYSFTTSNSPEKDEVKLLARELQEQVLNFTRNTLRRALSSVEDAAVPPVPPTPGVPPVPPMPPSPKAKRRVDIEVDDGDEDDTPEDDTPTRFV